MTDGYSKQTRPLPTPSAEPGDPFTPAAAGDAPVQGEETRVEAVAATGTEHAEQTDANPAAPDGAQAIAEASAASDAPADPANAAPDVRRITPRDRKQRQNMTAARRSLFADLAPLPPALPDAPVPLASPASDRIIDETSDYARFMPPVTDESSDPPEVAYVNTLDDLPPDELTALSDDIAPAADSVLDSQTFAALVDPAERQRAPSAADTNDLNAFIDELDSGYVRAVNELQADGGNGDDAAEPDDLDAFIDELDSSYVRTVSAEEAATPYAPPVRRPSEERFPPLPDEPAGERVRAYSPAPPPTPARKQAGTASRGFANVAPEPMRTGANARPASSGGQQSTRVQGGTGQGGRVPPGGAGSSDSLPPLNPRGRLNLLTLGLIGLAVVAIGYIAFIWRNPYSALNPLPPFTPLPIVITATFTPEPPSPTPSPEPPTPTPSPTLPATATPAESPTPESAAPPTPDESGNVNFRFTVQGGRTLYMTNPDSRGGCAWASIAGRVSTAEGEPLNNYRVRIVGRVGETQFDDELLTGSSPGFGPGGFELPVGRESVDADFTIQLIDPDGNAASDVFPFRTSSRCEWNIALLNFQEE